MNQLEISFGSPLRVVVEQAPPTITARLRVNYENFTITAEGSIMYTLPVDHFVTMQVSYVDAAGNPASVDGPVNWKSSDISIATVTADAADSTLVKVTPAGKLGQCQVTATADADLGAGTRALITNADIEIVAGEAVAGTISPVGQPQPV